MMRKTLITGLLLLAMDYPVLAGPGQHEAGPGGHGGGSGGMEAWQGPYRHWDGPGPRYGHGLPDFARELWIGSTLYFLAAGTYYLWNASQERYVVVEPPAGATLLPATSYDVIAYPATGQSQEQQARDRYECHRWAVSQSGFDPSQATREPTEQLAVYYQRALGACLSGRGYSIN